MNRMPPPPFGLSLSKPCAEVERAFRQAQRERSSVDELRRNGMKIEKVPLELGHEIKRLGERFSLEWVRQVGAEANAIFVPYFTQG